MLRNARYGNLLVSSLALEVADAFDAIPVQVKLPDGEVIPIGSRRPGPTRYETDNHRLVESDPTVQVYHAVLDPTIDVDEDPNTEFHRQQILAQMPVADDEEEDAPSSIELMADLGRQERCSTNECPHCICTLDPAGRCPNCGLDRNAGYDYAAFDLQIEVRRQAKRRPRGSATLNRALPALV